jgi:hypothetical protein
VLVATPTWTGSDVVIAIAKFDPFGEPDTTFGSEGLVVSSVSTYGPEIGMAVQSDGRILVSTSGASDEGFHMARFMPNGDPDLSYGTNGLSAVPGNFGGSPLRGRKMQLLADGSTLQFGRVQGQNPVILKRDPNGNATSGFGTDGYLMTYINDGSGYFIDGFVVPSGDVIAYGFIAPAYYLAIKLTYDPEANALPVVSANGDLLTTTGAGSFQWSLDGEEIAGATESTYEPTQNGTYTVTMSVSPECSYTSAPYSLLNVGLSEVSDTQLRIMDNPVADILAVQNDGAAMPYELLTIAGQRIASGMLRNGRNDIGMSGQASGVYLLRTTSNGGISTQRIVKH